jgi:hypothetical protein
VSRAWYLIGLVPLAIGLGIGALSFLHMIDDIKQMPRVVVPGEHAIELAGGDYIVFGESDSVVDGTAYHAEHFSVRCHLTGASAEPIELHSTAASTHYAIGGFSGTSMFTFTLPSMESVTLACTTDQDVKAVLAIGRGIGVRVVLAVLSLLGGILGTVLAMIVVYRRRKRLARHDGQ